MTDKAEQKLNDAIARMPSEIMPSRDLWPELEARLPARRGGSWRAARWAAVMAFLVAGLLGWRLTLDQRQAGPGLPELAGPDITLPGETIDEAQTPEMMLRQAYEMRKAEQLAAIDQIAEPYSGWQQQMAIWDEAVGQVAMALDYYPGEPQLLRQLQALYQQQLDYLQQLSAEPAYY